MLNLNIIETIFTQIKNQLKLLLDPVSRARSFLKSNGTNSQFASAFINEIRDAVINNVLNLTDEELKTTVMRSHIHIFTYSNMNIGFDH